MQVKRGSLNSYVGTVKWLQSGVVAFPIGAKLLDAKPAYIIPPLGTLGDFVIPLAFILVGLFAVIPWFLGTRKMAKNVAFASFALCVALIVIYGVCVSGSVVRVDLPSGKIVRVSVGTVRTEFARHFFPDESDTQMVKELGFSEEDIQRLWTEHSILLARGEMLGSYIGYLAMLNSCLGALAKASEFEKADGSQNVPVR